MENVGSTISQLQRALPFDTGVALSDKTAPRAKLNRSMRLNSHDVANVLKRGQRVRAVSPAQATGGVKPIVAKPSIDAKVLIRAHAGGMAGRQLGGPPIIAYSQYRPVYDGARLAIAVPKRLLKRSVDRNLVKRWMREALRQHKGRKADVDLLLTLTAKFSTKKRDDRLRIKIEIQQQVSLALGAAVAGGSFVSKNIRISS